MATEGEPGPLSPAELELFSACGDAWARQGTTRGRMVAWACAALVVVAAGVGWWVGWA